MDNKTPLVQQTQGKNTMSRNRGNFGILSEASDDDQEELYSNHEDELASTEEGHIGIGSEDMFVGTSNVNQEEREEDSEKEEEEEE